MLINQEGRKRIEIEMLTKMINFYSCSKNQFFFFVQRVEKIFFLHYQRFFLVHLIVSVRRTFRKKFQRNPWAGMSFIDVRVLVLQAHNNKRARVSRTTLAKRYPKFNHPHIFNDSRILLLCVRFYVFLSCSSLSFVNFHFRHIFKCILQFPSVPKTNKKSFRQQLKSVSELNWTNCFFRFKVRLSQSKNWWNSV